MLPVSLETRIPSQHPVSCLTSCFRRMPGQELVPMPLALVQGSLVDHWDLDQAPMEPPPHTLVLTDLLILCVCGAHTPTHTHYGL